MAGVDWGMSLQKLPGNHPLLKRQGRIPRTEHPETVLVWQGSTVKARFEGRHLGLQLRCEGEQVHLDIEVDDAREQVSLAAGQGCHWVWPHPLGEGIHRLRIHKRSEAMAGQGILGGIEIEAQATLLAPEPESQSTRILFIGDSITVGACNEDGATDQWEDRSTHNHGNSYPALTCRELNWEHRCIAVSGMGICEGFVSVKAGEIWKRTHPDTSAPHHSPDGWEPDHICILLGENDSAFTREQGRPFPKNFQKDYEALVRDVAAEHPKASIHLLRGGMYGGANDPKLAEAWQAATESLKADIPNLQTLVFQHWSEQHPRVEDARLLARELMAHLRGKPGVTGQESA